MDEDSSLVVRDRPPPAAAPVDDADEREPQRPGLVDYEAIFRHSLDGLLFTGTDGQIYAANSAACEIFGRTEAEICACGRAGLVAKDDPEVARALKERDASGSVRAQFPMLRGDGSTFIADVASSTFITADGAVRACVIFRDVTEQSSLREQLVRQARENERLSVLDPLSGLLNRRGFAARVAQALDFADRAHVPVQLLFIDVDKLKAINDAYGHQRGDEVLAKLGRAVADVIRDIDVGARLAGDEFVVLLYDASDQGARTCLGRITDAFAGPDESGLAASFSAGVQGREAGSNASLEELLRLADQDMYAQKAARYP